MSTSEPDLALFTNAMATEGALVRNTFTLTYSEHTLLKKQTHQRGEEEPPHTENGVEPPKSTVITLQCGMTTGSGKGACPSPADGCQ